MGEDSYRGEKDADGRQRADRIPDLSGFHILVSDDGEDSRLLLERMLRGSGANIEFVASSVASVPKSSLMAYDIVIMEIQRPIEMAIELIMGLRAQGYERPVIGLTASLIKDQREFFITNGFSEIILKPFHVQQFRETVAHLLRVGFSSHAPADLTFEGEKIPRMDRLYQRWPSPRELLDRHAPLINV